MYFTSQGKHTRQAHKGIPEGCVEEEQGRRGFFGNVSHLIRRKQPTRWKVIDGPLKPRMFDLVKAEKSEARQRLLEVGHDHGKVAPGRGNRLLLGHQVDLGSPALQPGVLAQARGRLDPLETEQGEELDRALDVLGRNLDADVVKHGGEVRGTEPLHLRVRTGGATFCLLA